MKKHIFILLLFVAGFFYGQNYNDSLRKILKSTISDSSKSCIYNDLCFEYRNLGILDSSLIFGKKGLVISKSTHHYLNSSKLLNSLGTTYAFLGITDTSEICFKEAIHYSLLSKNKKILSKSYSNMGRLYFNLSKYNEAYKYYLLSLNINQEIKHFPGIASNYNNIGGLYYQQEKYNEALIYYLKSDSLYETLGGDSEQGHLKNNIANIYTELKKYKTALNYYEEALKKHKQYQNILGEASILENAGIALYEAHNKKMYLEGVVFNDGKISYENYIDSALAFHLNAYKIYKEAEYVYNYSANLTGIGKIYLEKNNIEKALKYCQLSLQYADSTQSLDKQLTACQCLYMSYEKSNNTAKSYEYYKKFIAIRDSIYNKENSEKFLHQQLSYEFEKKENLAKFEQGKKDVIALEEKQKQKLITYVVSFGLLFMLVFAGFIFRSLRLNQKKNKIISEQKKITEIQKHLVEEKHKEITDSINYAERIQRAFLATKELLDENLIDYFVFFKPKDVVSGDFYWAETLSNGNFALVTADSTGHGVPGAIMSLLNISSLEKAIEHHANPAGILAYTRNVIIKRLKNDGSTEGGKDGMDCSIIVFDKVNSKLLVSAANNPVWIVRNTELIEIKPDKMPVGKHDRDQDTFTSHAFDLQKNDLIYTLTDGFPDQFGGEKGKKFMSKNLKELLLANSRLSMSEQKQILENTFENWKNGIEQVDDVTLIGIKV